MNEHSQNSTGKGRKMIAFLSFVQILGMIGTALAFLLPAIFPDFFRSLGWDVWTVLGVATIPLLLWALALRL